MDESLPTDADHGEVLAPAAPARQDNPRRRWSWQRFGGKFLVISVLAHVLFLAVAAYLVVQTYQARKKPDFKPIGRGANASERLLDHSIKTKKQKSGGSPPSAKRVTVANSNSKVTLPSMPAMPTMSTSSLSASVAGMGMGTGMGLGVGGGSGSGMGGSGGGGGGTFFNIGGSGSGLAGTFYDLKQTSSRQPNGMTNEKYGQIVQQFVRGNFNTGMLNLYFRSPKPLYTNMILIPNIAADLGPACFNLQNQVKPSKWVVVYRGKVAPPESGDYRFVGAGDDLLVVRFDNKTVLDRNWYVPGSIDGQQELIDYHYTAIPRGFGRGPRFHADAGHYYDMEVLIGEQPGGFMFASLLIQKEGVEYKKTGNGVPIYPVFRTANVKPLPPPGGNGSGYPPHDANGPVWRTGSQSAFALGN